jgi:hypothetical protein
MVWLFTHQKDPASSLEEQPDPYQAQMSAHNNW